MSLYSEVLLRLFSGQLGGGAELFLSSIRESALHANKLVSGLLD